MAINYQWVLDEWRTFLDMTERVKTGEIVGRRETRAVYSFKVSDDEVKQQLSVVIHSFKVVFDGWQWHHDFRSLNAQVKIMRECVHAAIPLIERREEIDANLSLDEDGPQIAADDLHHWVWSAARPHWESGNYRAAVHAAATNVNSRMRRKMGRYDVSEVQAATEAFRPEPAEPGRPRLRLSAKEDPQHFNSVQRGAMDFGRGLFAAVRNPVAHLADDEHDLPEQEALECLAAFSLFARWVDRADVETVE